MEAIGAASSIVQLISFTGEVLVLGYGYLAKVKKAPSELSVLFREIAILNSLLNELQDLVLSPTKKEDASIKGALETLEKLGIFEDCEMLMRMIEKAVKSCEQIDGEKFKNVGRRMVWPFKEKEMKDLMGQLGWLREALSAAVVVDSAGMLRELEVVVRNVDKGVIRALIDITEVKSTTTSAAEDMSHVKAALNASMEEAEIAAIRRWLHPEYVETEAGFTAALSQKHSETGSWLLDSKHFEEWSGGKHRCMWLYGIAGCGKTVLAATAIDHIQKSKSASSIVLYFFCDHRDPAKQSFQDLLHALIKQLLDLNVACFNEAKRWRDKKVPGPNSSTRPLTTTEYIDLIQTLLSRWESASLVVDAVDECSEIHTFVGGLEKLTTNASVKLLLTSRHDVELIRFIHPIAGYKIPVVDHMQDDIQIFLASEVKKRIACGVLKYRQLGLDLTIVSTIKEKADGMILIAKLQLDFICALKSDRAIKEALIKLPSRIYPMYDEILRQICSKRPDDLEDIKCILQWLLYSMVPLTLPQVAEIVSVREGDQRFDVSGVATDLLDLAASLGSLVTLYTQDTTGGQYEDLRGSHLTFITLAHYSVEEYLKSGKMDPELATFFNMDAHTVHHALSKTCLQYIGFNDFSIPIRYSVHSPGKGQYKFIKHNLDEERWLLLRRTYNYKFYDYACRYWSDHLRRVTLSRLSHPETIELLDWFTNPEKHEGNYVSWQQMYHHDIVYYCPGRPPFYYAIEFKIDPLVSLLLPPKEEVDRLHRGVSALHVASRCGALSIAQRLLDFGATVNLRSMKDPKGIHSLMTPLHFAAEGGHADVLRLLLSHGASPHSKNEGGTTPFYRAARSGSVEALKVLHDAGSDINNQKYGGTPLYEAVTHCRPRIACQLLYWGADPTIVLRDDNACVLTVLRDAYNESLIQDFWSTNLEGEKGELQIKQRWASEKDIYDKIQIIRAQGKGPEAFLPLLKGLKRTHVFLKQMEKDTRPGTEREKDFRYPLDLTRIVTMVDFQDRDERMNSELDGFEHRESK